MTALILLLQFALAAGPVKVVYVGDSITAGYGIDEKRAYPWRVDKKLKDQGYSIETVNASVSGSLSSSAAGRVKWILKSQPDVLVLALGGNDGLKGTPSSEIKKNLTEAIDLAEKANVQVVLAGFKMFSNLGAQYTHQFESVYKELAKDKKIIFIPFLLEGVGANAQLNQADGKHPNEKGHEIIAQVAMPHIEKAVKLATQSRKHP